MNLFVEIIAILADVALTCFFYSKHLYRKKFNIFACIIFLILYSIILTFGTFFLSFFSRITLLIITYFVGNHFVFKIENLKLLYLTILFLTSSIMSDLLCSSVLVSIIGISIQAISNNIIVKLIYYSFAKLIHLILLLIINHCLNKDKTSRSLFSLIPLILCHSASFLIFYLIYQFLLQGGNPHLIAFSTSALLYINIVLCFYIEFLRQHHDDHEKRIVAEQQLKINQRFYADMLQRQEETRSLWHDIKKYVLAIETLIAENKTKDAKSQTKQIINAYEQIRYTVDSGNVIVDSILNHETIWAKQNNIRLHLELWISSEFSVSATDLYVILGNTIDNAIEACTHLSDANQRIINIKLLQKEHILLYEISNPYLPQKKSFSQKRIHGYGLANVEKCVEKNQGTMKINADESLYTVTIMLNV